MPICNGFKPQIRGDNVRDWGAECLEGIVFPYNDQLKQWRTIPKLPCWAWLHALRTELWGRSTFGGGTYRGNTNAISGMTFFAGGSQTTTMSHWVLYGFKI